jgi:hypothetical protein
LRVFGALSWIVPVRTADIAFIAPCSIEFWQGPLGAFVRALAHFLTAIQLDQGIQTIIAGVLLVTLISGGGICALKKRYYWWAFSGAICLLCTGIIAGALCAYDFLWSHLHEVSWGASIGAPLLLPGSLALAFLLKSKGQFHKRAQVGGGL